MGGLQAQLAGKCGYCRMIGDAMGRKLLGDLEQALNTGASVVRHVTWFVRYHMGGSARGGEGGGSGPEG